MAYLFKARLRWGGGGGGGGWGLIEAEGQEPLGGQMVPVIDF